MKPHKSNGKNPIKGSSAPGIPGNNRMQGNRGNSTGAKDSAGATGGERYTAVTETHKGGVPPGKGGENKYATSCKDY